MDGTPDTPAAPPTRVRRLAVLAGVVVLSLAGLAVAARLLVATPPGRTLVENVLDGMSLGPLGVLEVEGLRGDPLGRARIERLAIADVDGTWLEIEHLMLRWHPGSLLHRIVYVEELDAERVHLARRPSLGGGSGGGGRAWGFAFDALRLPVIELDQAVVGAAAVLAADARVDAARDGALSVDVDLRRTDVPGDVLTVQGEIDRTGRGDLEGELIAPAGGPLARLVRMPSQMIRARASLDGDLREGEGTIDARLEDVPFVTADLRWGADGVAAETVVRLGVAPELSSLTGRLGPEAQASLTLGPAVGGGRTLVLDASAEGLTLHAAGGVDIARRTAPDGLAVTASTPDLDRLIGDGVIEDAVLGAANAAGTLIWGDGVAFEGTIDAAELAYRDWGAATASGPMAVSYDGGRARVDADLSTTEARGPERLASMLGAAPRISAVVDYDYAARRLQVSDAGLVGAAGEATGEANVTFGGGPLTARVDMTISDASYVPQLAAGSGRLTLALNRDAAGEPIRVEASGEGQDLTAVSPALSDLLGRSASIDIAADLADGGARIERASLQAEHLLLEARGGVSRADGYNLDIDLAAEGPAAAGPLDIDGRATAEARLEGAYDAPLLRLDARADTLAIGPVALTAPRFRAELADVFAAPWGVIAFDAETEQGPAALSGEVSYRDGALQARAIEGGWRGFTLTGEASRGPDTAPQGMLTVGGLGGRLAADVNLELEDGPPRLDLHMTLRDQPIADAGALTALNVSVIGPLDRLEIAASARGYAGAAFTMEASGTVERSGDETRLTLAPRGMLGDDPIRAPEPWMAVFRGGDARIAASLDAGGGSLAARLDRVGGVTELAAELNDAPLSLVNFVRPNPVLDGRVSASIDLRGERALEGSSRLTIADARAPDYAPDDLLDLTLSLEQGADGADVAFTAADGAGFSASVDGRAPLVLAAWPPAPRFDRDAAVSLAGEAEGDVAALWALVGVPVVALEGVIDARGSLAGSLRAPAFEGEASVAGGRLEEARIGLLLTDVQGRARLQGPRLVIESAEAGDGMGGRVTAEGEVTFGGEPGSIARAEVMLSGLQVVRTTDNRAEASGDLTFVRDANGARLAGDLVIDRADITPPQGRQGAAAIPTLDVVEINRPDDLAPPPTARRSALALDIAASAPRRVFIRSNSLDTEWAFDVDVTGTSAAPRVSGSATLVRGDITLAGERFALEEARLVFNGDPRQARIDLTARRDSAAIAVTAHVTGTAERPEIALTSTPAYPQDEILARVLFGRATSELTALEAAQLASALSSMAGGGGFDLLGPLRQTLGVDRLGVRGDGRGGALVAGGRYIAEDVYLEVASTPTGLAQASIEWEIRPRLELVSRFGLGRDTSVSLRWRKDY